MFEMITDEQEHKITEFMKGRLSELKESNRVAFTFAVSELPNTNTDGEVDGQTGKSFTLYKRGAQSCSLVCWNAAMESGDVRIIVIEAAHPGDEVLNKLIAFATDLFGFPPEVQVS